jgi:putative ABC transport system permease protein
MLLLHRTIMWLRALTDSGRADRELDREIAAHLAMERAHLEANGVDADTARRIAAVHFGGVDRYKEAVRDERGTRWLQDLAADFRVAIRGLRQRPTFALGVLLTLGIGIGAVTVIFAWADALLWQPVAGVAAPSRLVPLVFVNPADGYAPYGISYPHFLAARREPALRQSTAVSSMPVQIGRADEPARNAAADLVGGDYFGVLGVTPALGRFFSSGELDPASAERVVVISDALWRSHFGGSRAVIGRTMPINALPYTIIGVTPARFRGTSRADTIAMWLPGAAFQALRHGSATFTATNPATRLFDDVIVRLPRGTTPAAAKFALQRAAIASTAGTEDSTAYQDYPATIDGVFGTSMRLYGDLVHLTRLLLGVVGLILLIACANTANLLLLRGMRRRGEFAVRRALGASWSRVLRQHATEGVVIAALSALAGIVLAAVLARLLGSISTYGLPAFSRVTIDARVAAMAVGLALATGLLFSMVPAVAALRLDPGRHLREGGRGSSGTSGLARNTLTVLQIAAAMTLTVGALLLARTVHRLTQVDLGLNAAHLATFDVATDPQGYSKPRMHALRVDMIDWMRHQPGVSAAAAGASTQFAGSTFNERLRPIGTVGKHWPVEAVSYAISPDYFAAMGIPLLAGRTFSAAEFDDSASTSVLLSRTTARHLFGATNPVGQQFEVQGFAGITRLTVIGLVGDARIYSLRAPFAPTMYRPSPPMEWGTTFVVRSSAPLAQLKREFEAGLMRFDPSLPMGTATTMSASVERTFARERLLARMLSVLAVIAGVLAGIGLYSVIAYAVSQRTREIGIRIALGALGDRVMLLVVGQGLVLAAAGIAVGIAGAYALSRSVQQLLFGVSATSGRTYVAAAVVALVITLAACALPARTATRINPVDALRSE